MSYQNLDLYEFNLLVREWNLDFIQLRPGVLSADIAQVIGKDFQLGYAGFNIMVRQEGYSPQGMWTFAFVNDVKLFWRNYVIPPASIIVYAPGSIINAVSGPGFEVMTFSIDEKTLLKWAKNHQSLDLIHRLNEAEVLQSTFTDNQLFRNNIFKEIKDFRRGNKTQSDEFSIDDFLHELCKIIIGSKKSTKEVSSLNRLKLLVDSEAILVEQFSDSPTIAELAEKFNVSERTLLYTFKRRYDLGAKAFLQVLKLNHTYHILRNGIDGSIATAARQSGFWHMGQFSSDYKRFFKELPSETLGKVDKKIKN